MRPFFRTVLSVGIVAGSCFAVLAQVGGENPQPISRTCKFCHPDWPTLCDSVVCQPGSTGCTGTTGTTSTGTPKVTAICLYEV